MKLSGQRVAVLVANAGVEQIELTKPWSSIETEGGIPTLVAPKMGTVQAFDHLDAADTFVSTVSTADATPSEYVGLVLPGGVANPDALRIDEPAIDFVRAFFDSGRPVAVICHGPWTLVEADVVRGRTLTSWPSLRTDIINAGGTWVDEEVKVCDNGPNRLVSSRKPDDLPAFTNAMIEAFVAAPVR